MTTENNILQYFIYLHQTPETCNVNCSSCEVIFNCTYFGLGFLASKVQIPRKEFRQFRYQTACNICLHEELKLTRKHNTDEYAS